MADDDTRRFRDIQITEPGSFSGFKTDGSVGFSASFPLFLIREAWHAGCDFEDLADGFEGIAYRVDLESGSTEPVARGKGTGGDWSGIRDSSPEAIEQMLERALNFFFGSG